MSKEALNLVQKSWLRRRSDGAELGALFRMNLRKINPTLIPIESRATEGFADLLLLQSIDEVINRLDQKQELVRALRSFCSLFELSNDKKKEIENISKAILVTVDQVMADYFTGQLGEVRNLMSDKLADAEPGIERSNFGDQWMSYIKRKNKTY